MPGHWVVWVLVDRLGSKEVRILQMLLVTDVGTVSHLGRRSGSRSVEGGREEEECQ